MDQYKMSKRKADTISNGAFLIALGVLIYSNYWWPGILAALWVSIGLRQFLTGRIYDFCISTLILLGLFAITVLNFEWAVLLPVLFIVGGIYIIFREYFFAEDLNGEDKSQEILDDTDNENPK
ncbi:MAG: hypothetical protein H0X29_04380 [Parachlamydiaceae bacterium]|nr:hypothetical protein [Parachlamydiaceae bacterium]